MAKVTSKLPSALRASTLVVLGAAAVELTLYFRFDTKPSFFFVNFSLLFSFFAFSCFFFSLFLFCIFFCFALFLHVP